VLLELREEHRDKDEEEGSGSLAAQRSQLNICFSQAEALSSPAKDKSIRN